MHFFLANVFLCLSRLSFRRWWSSFCFRRRWLLTAVLALLSLRLLLEWQLTYCANAVFESPAVEAISVIEILSRNFGCFYHFASTTMNGRTGELKCRTTSPAEAPAMCPLLPANAAWYCVRSRLSVCLCVRNAVTFESIESSFFFRIFRSRTMSRLSDQGQSHRSNKRVFVSCSRVDWPTLG